VPDAVSDRVYKPRHRVTSRATKSSNFDPIAVVAMYGGNA
jgi:hypothetical protein